MLESTDAIDVRSYATSVMAALTDLQGYLSTAVNPDRIALADLGMEPMGWTKRAYSEKAFMIWQEQHQLFPEDPLVLHHLAIMHHARAFDLEMGERPADADADWVAAMEHWHHLHGMDLFWDNLTKKACAGTNRQDAIRKLRAEFPQMLLAVHYDIALDVETRRKRKSRALFHIGMVHNAPFPPEVRAESQRAAYSRYISMVPDEVWQRNELREEVLNEGQEAIVEYLNYDPRSVPALEDALRIQRRIQRSRYNAWGAMSDGDPNRKVLLHREKKDARAWGPFFDQLADMADQLDDDVRQDLARWYRGRGDALCGLDEIEDAVGFFQQAVRVCRDDDDDRAGYVRDLVHTRALVARKKAVEGVPGARSYCDRIIARDDLSMSACFFLAQAYTHLGEYDHATTLCDYGLKIEPDFDDFEADEWLERLAKYKGHISLGRLVSLGTDALQKGRPDDAWIHLTDAANAARTAGTTKDNWMIYCFRAQAHLALNQVEEARRDVEHCERLVDPASPAEIQALDQLRQIVSQAERALQEFGGPEASRLRQHAIAAFNSHRQDEAISLFRRAIAASMEHGHRTGAPKLKAELSAVLTSKAIDIVNRAQEGM